MSKNFFSMGVTFGFGGFSETRCTRFGETRCTRFGETRFARFGETRFARFQTASSGIIFSVPFSLFALFAVYRLGQDFCRHT